MVFIRGIDEGDFSGVLASGSGATTVFVRLPLKLFNEHTPPKVLGKDVFLMVILAGKEDG